MSVATVLAPHCANVTTATKVARLEIVASMTFAAKGTRPMEVLGTDVLAAVASVGHLGVQKKQSFDLYYKFLKDSTINK